MNGLEFITLLKLIADMLSIGMDMIWFGVFLAALSPVYLLMFWRVRPRQAEDALARIGREDRARREEMGYD